MAMDREEIRAKVTEALMDALSVDEEEVTDDATLMGDLGAESIDFLDQDSSRGAISGGERLE